MSFAFLAVTLLFSANPEPVSANGAKSTSDDSVICRRYTDTGSLVKKTRVCRTKSEWRRVAEAAEKESRDLVENQQSR